MHQQRGTGNSLEGSSDLELEALDSILRDQVKGVCEILFLLPDREGVRQAQRAER